jgi:hypothetical protein
MTLFWLRDRCGLSRAAGFAAGRVSVQLCQGLVFGYALRMAEEAAGERRANRLESTLLLIVGVLWLVTVVATYFRKPRSEGPPRWMSAMRTVSPLTAFGIGGLMVGASIRQWVFTLSAIALIEKATLDWPRIAFAYLFFVVAAHTLILAPVVAAAVAPVSATRLLVAGHDWLERNKRGVTIAVSLVFGIWFCWQGISGLVGQDRGSFDKVAAAPA